MNGKSLDGKSHIKYNGTIAGNVWHTMRLVVDKDSPDSVKVFLDNVYFGSFNEYFPPRRTGGFFTLNSVHYNNVALFKEFSLNECLSFNPIGECKFAI